MTTAIIVVIVVVVLAIAVAVTYLIRSRALRGRFGPEYRRAVAQAGGRLSGERELLRRERRHAGLTLHPLSAEDQQRYTSRWRTVQAVFVESPSEAVTQADTLVTELMSARGYPTADFDQRVADLSVEHADTLERYRTAHELSLRNDQGTVDTEELRQAVVHYRALFAGLLDADPTATTRANEAPAAEPDAPDAESDRRRSTRSTAGHDADAPPRATAGDPTTTDQN